jgi:hypothetical protein
VPTETTTGSHRNTAFVYDRRGERRLFQLQVGSIEWGRSLCEISRASVTIPAARCTPALDAIAPWGHSLVVYRGNRRVWEGPITRRGDTRDGLTLAAADVLGWLERRPIRSARRAGSTSVRAEIQGLIGQGFGTDDPNVIAHVQTPYAAEMGPGPTTARDVAPFTGYYADELANLVAAGGRYTVLGRSILIWHEDGNLGVLPTLVPERHLVADVEVVQDGYELATEVVARNDNGGYAINAGADGDRVDPFYGHVGQLVPVTGPQQAVTLRRVAASAYARANPNPITIDVPGDAAVRADAPFPVEALVPGMAWPVTTTTATGRTVTGDFILSSVKVTETGGAPEQVAVTLAPPTETAA